MLVWVSFWRLNARLQLGMIEMLSELLKQLSGLNKVDDHQLTNE